MKPVKVLKGAASDKRVKQLRKMGYQVKKVKVSGGTLILKRKINKRKF